MATLLADFDTAHCGLIHDAQIDPFGQCLATASADGHVRLWDIREPTEPAFLTELSGHAGAVHQVAWAPPNCGALLASASSDGSVALWGRRAKRPTEWQMLRRQELERYGAVRALAWAPHEHGVVLACASANGVVTVLTYLGPFFSGEDAVEHRWQDNSFQAHPRQANGCSWASPPEFADKAVGMKGARLATAGDNGVCIWSWDDDEEKWWEEEVGDRAPPAPAAETGAVVPASPAPPERPEKVARDVAWKPWDGLCEWLASACGETVVFWTQKDDGFGEQWRAVEQVSLGEEVWKVSWSDIGGVLLVSFGGKEQRTALLKQRLDGVWDIMDVAPQEN